MPNSLDKRILRRELHHSVSECKCGTHEDSGDEEGKISGRRPCTLPSKEHRTDVHEVYDAAVLR